MTTTGKLFGIIGHKIGYSLSPVIYNRLFVQSQIAAGYGLFDIAPSELTTFMESVRLLPLDAFNVTTPYKTEIISHLDKLDAIALACSSVNLVTNRRGGLTGCNTDYQGIKATIEQKLKLYPAGKRVAIIGSGGAARTVYYYLIRSRAKQVTVYHHSADREREFAAYTGSLPRADSYICRSFRKKIPDLADIDLCVNCTPQPVSRLLSSNVLKQVGRVFELRYNTGIRPGKHYCDGDFMLAVQAAANFELMTGMAVNVDKIVKIIGQARRR